LELVLERENPEDVGEVYDAYSQCQWLGIYLATIGERDSFQRLLAEIGDENVTRNLIILLKRGQRADTAFRRVFGAGIKVVFAAAKASMDLVRNQSGSAMRPRNS
jgi:hypothetical protein